MSEGHSLNATTDAALDDRQLREAVQFALAQASKHGASDAEAAASLSQGLAVNVRKGELERWNPGSWLIVSVYFGQRTGRQYLGLFLFSGGRNRAGGLRIAKFTEEDAAGLTDQNVLRKSRLTWIFIILSR